MKLPDDSYDSLFVQLFDSKICLSNSVVPKLTMVAVPFFPSILSPALTILDPVRSCTIQHGSIWEYQEEETTWDILQYLCEFFVAHLSATDAETTDLIYKAAADDRKGIFFEQVFPLLSLQDKIHFLWV